MSQEINLEKLEPQSILYRARQCAHDDMQSALADIFPSIFMYATKSGITMVSQPLTRYLSWGPGLLSIEAGIAVAPGAVGEGDIKVGELPGGDAAVTIHKGPYDGLREAYSALERWMADNGRKPGGAPWEVYLTDPGEVPNPKEWQTKVAWPLAVETS